MIMWSSEYRKIPKPLTKFDEQNSCGGYRAICVGSHTLKVAGVCGVQVPDSQSRAVLSRPERDAPRFLDHGGIVF